MGSAGGEPEFEYRGPVLASFRCPAVLLSDLADHLLDALTLGACGVSGTEASELARAVASPDSNGFYELDLITGLYGDYVVVFRHNGWEYQIVRSIENGSVRVRYLVTIPPSSQ